MARSQRGIVTETLHGKYREAGYEVVAHHAKSRKLGGTVILLKGGLGDPSSETMKPLAEELIDISNGQLIVGRVNTVRPSRPLKAVMGSFRARKHRSQSMRGASDLINDRFHPKFLVLSGQSEGGISAVDGAMWQVDHPRKTVKSPLLGVVTIDAPGVYNSLASDREATENIANLGINCMEDISRLSMKRKVQLLGGFARKASPYEIMYFINEARYLQNVNMSDDISYLRDRGVPVMHVWHDGDVVPGAAMACDFSRVHEGGHMRFMREPAPVAADIYDLAQMVAEYPQAA